ncbi:unnamed protein product [Paramecium pentaurelia]|uniref:Transmembrane protein n=1 Tax=Paramecium pentaurelia TaxID=43138 RepID=A0A8S1VF42_9CILI|nr:unnamed protein product [Paramecium pentaurelia]
MIQDLIKKVDLLVDPYEFNTSAKEKSLTLLGGIVSILLLIFTLFYIVEIIFRFNENQNYIYAGTQSETFPELILNQNNTIFALELTSDNGSILSNMTDLLNYITISAFYVQQSRIEGILGSTKNYSQMKKEKCSQAVIKKLNFNPASMTEEQKENLICFSGHFELSGQYYDPKFNYIKISVEICDNMVNNNCKDVKEIEEFIQQGINVNLFIRGSKIKQKLDPITPDNVSPVNIYSRLMTMLGNRENIYLKPISMDIKKIQFFYEMFGIEETQQLFSGSIVEKKETIMEPISIKPQTSLCNLYLRVSSDSSFFFVKQQDLISIVLSAISEGTALLFAAMQFIKFFYKYYNQHKTLEVLMNQIFKFDMSKVKQRRIKKAITNQQTQILEEQLDQILKPTVDYSFYKYIKYIIQHCFKKFMVEAEDTELIISQIAKEKIEYDLDLSNILKKLYEIDCLKLFLFDDDQLMIFNSFSFPVFTDQTEQQRQTFLQIEQLLNQGTKIQQVQDYVIENDQQTCQDADQSKIPITQRLAKINWFFKSQLIVDAKNLNLNYERIYKDDNENKSMNQQLIKFTKLNKSLYDLIKCNTQKQSQALNQQVTENNQNVNNLNHQNIEVFESQEEEINDERVRVPHRFITQNI